MLQSLREETEGKLQMLLSLRKNHLDSLFKEVRVFKEFGESHVLYVGGYFGMSLAFLFCSWSRGCQVYTFFFSLERSFRAQALATLRRET